MPPPRKQRPGQLGRYWLTQNRHGVWQRTWFDSAKRHVAGASLGTRDFDEALMLLAEWIVLNERLEKERAADVPLYTVLDRYHEHHAKQNTARAGEASALAIAKLKKVYTSETTVADMTLDRQYELERWMRSQGASTGYIGRVQSTLKAAFNWAIDNGELVNAPFVRILPSGKRYRVFSLAESAKLLNTPMPEHIWMLVLLMFNTLSRPGALLELQPFQLDFKRRLLALNPPGREQTKKRRPVVPITDTLLPWLQARREQRYLVQWHKQQAEPIGSVKTSWRKLRKAAGFGKEVIPYTIRHTMASEMRARGVPKWEVDGWLGHGGGTTDLYAKFAPDYLAKGSTAIDDYMNELQPMVKRELITNVTSIGKGRKA